MEEILPEKLLNESAHERVQTALGYYRNCEEIELDEAVKELEDLNVNFLVYINTTDEHSRRRMKRIRKAELEDVACGYCADPVLECNC